MTPRREMRFDCHIHSKYSPDGRGTLREIVDAAKARGLDGFALTDHNTVRGHADIKRLKDPGLLIIPGIEVSTADGHCLALGATEPVPAGLPLEETLELIKDLAGVGVPSHPKRRVHGVGARRVRASAGSLSALEVYNAHDGDRKSQRSELLAIDLGLGGTGGSDAHRPQDVGLGWTSVKSEVSSVDAFLKRVANKRTWGAGLPYRRRDKLRKNAKSFARFVGRGFRSI